MVTKVDPRTERVNISDECRSTACGCLILHSVMNDLWMSNITQCNERPVDVSYYTV